MRGDLAKTMGVTAVAQIAAGQYVQDQRIRLVFRSRDWKADLRRAPAWCLEQKVSPLSAVAVASLDVPADVRGKQHAMLALEPSRCDYLHACLACADVTP